MTDYEKPLPVYFKSIELENIRCFGDRQELSLSDSTGRPAQWNLILGDNGVGKTTLLQCLAWMRPVSSDEKKKHYQPDLYNEENQVLDSLVRVGDDVHAKIKATLSVGQELGDADEEMGHDESAGHETDDKKTGYKELHPEFSMRRVSGSLEDPDKPSSPQKRLTDTLPDFAIFGYGATRRPGTDKLEKGNLSNPLRSLFGHEATLYDAQDILLQLDYRAEKNKDDRDRDRLERVKEILATVLPDITDVGEVQIFGPEVLGRPKEEGGVRFKMPYGMVPVSALSLGYQTMLTWVVDLAMRLYDHYPDSPKPLSEPGIVFIDSIDIHLHPKWQRQVMQDISGHFPALQFIATAHSPLIVQATRRANLSVLRLKGEQVVITENSDSVNHWRADQILASDLFDNTPTRSKDIENLRKKRNELLENMDRNKGEEQHLAELEKRLSKLPTADNRSHEEDMELIHRVAKKLKQKDPDLS